MRDSKKKRGKKGLDLGIYGAGLPRECEPEPVVASWASLDGWDLLLKYDSKVGTLMMASFLF